MGTRLLLVWPIAFLAMCCNGDPSYMSAIISGKDVHGKYIVEIVRGPGQGCADAAYDDLVNETGWGELTVRASATCHFEEAAYAMGYLEGQLTWFRMWQAFQNFNHSNSWLVGGNLPPAISSFVVKQTDWMVHMTKTNSDDYWKHASALLLQAEGMAAGYAAIAPSDKALSAAQVYILTLAGDLEDLSEVFSDNAPLKTSTSHMDCSALVKLSANDLFVGHTTFNAYW
jgi:hypothetical protein